MAKVAGRSTGGIPLPPTAGPGSSTATRGLVRRSATDGDGRSVHVTLTAAGRSLVDEVMPGHLETEQQILAGLSDRQRRDLADGLRRLLEHLS